MGIFEVTVSLVRLCVSLVRLCFNFRRGPPHEIFGSRLAVDWLRGNRPLASFLRLGAECRFAFDLEKPKLYKLIESTGRGWPCYPDLRSLPHGIDDLAIVAAVVP